MKVQTVSRKEWVELPCLLSEVKFKQMEQTVERDLQSQSRLPVHWNQSIVQHWYSDNSETDSFKKESPCRWGDRKWLSLEPETAIWRTARGHWGSHICRHSVSQWSSSSESRWSALETKSTEKKQVSLITGVYRQRHQDWREWPLMLQWTSSHPKKYNNVPF